MEHKVRRGKIKVNIYKVADLTPGLVCDQPMYVDDEVLFIPAGIPIQEKDLAKLAEMGTMELSSNGTLNLSEGEFGDPSKVCLLGSHVFSGLPIDEELIKLYDVAAKKLERVFMDMSYSKRVNLEELTAISSSLINAIQKKGHQQIVQMVPATARVAHNLARSAINTAILALTMGADREGYPRIRLQNLASGALLHDIGMIRIPDQVKQKIGNLSSEEQKLIKSHPQHSFEIIVQELGYDEFVGQMVLQHHERWDGKGYPNRLSGTNILEEARIIAVADAFEAMRHEQTHHPSKERASYEAMKEIICHSNKNFDPSIVKTFTRCVGVYPIGTLVQLNDRTMARIVESNPEAPLRPQVIIVRDKDEKVTDKREVLDLQSTKGIFITSALSHDSLS